MQATARRPSVVSATSYARRRLIRVGQPISSLAMTRYLTSAQIESALNRDKPVEQFLGPSREGSIAWLEIRPAGVGFQLWRFEAVDDGNEDFLDLYSFSPANGDWPEEPLSVHDSLADAILAAELSCAASPDRWVNQFVIQDEYRDYLPTRE